jgi:hypothetical protein
MYKNVLFLCLSMMIYTTSFGQTADTLFYGNTPNIAENPFGSGYIGGTNAYLDIGKYQRFDFESEVSITGARIHFAIIQMGGETFNDIDIVVRAVADNGAPSDIIHSETVNLSQASQGIEGNFFSFEEALDLSDYNITSIFIGIEWAAATDDVFAIYLDSNGEGDGAGRAWERFDDGSFNDFGTQLNPTFSWGRDADLWIAAVFVPVSTSLEKNDFVPQEVALLQNYPNPFNPSTKIRFELPESQKITIRVYDVNGRMITELVNDQMYIAGTHQVTFDGTGLSTGIYIYNLTTETGYNISKKLSLVK